MNLCKKCNHPGGIKHLVFDSAKWARVGKVYNLSVKVEVLDDESKFRDDRDDRDESKFRDDRDDRDDIDTCKDNLTGLEAYTGEGKNGQND